MKKYFVHFLNKDSSKNILLNFSIFLGKFFFKYNFEKKLDARLLSELMLNYFFLKISKANVLYDMMKFLFSFVEETMMKQILFFGLAVCLSSLSIEAWNGFQDTLVPAYFYPGPLWDQMINVGAGIVIANPNSGPGTSFDPTYGLYINKTRKVPIDVRGNCFSKIFVFPIDKVNLIRGKLE